MTSTLPSSQYMNPTLYQFRKRVVLKRSTYQINDPIVIQQKYSNRATPKKSVRFHDEDKLEHIRYFYKTQSPVTVKNDPPFMDTSADDYKLTQPNWPSRNTMFYQSDKKIRMESVQLVDGDYDQMVNNKFVIEGRCRAANLSFHKVVSIRYTFDLWRTYQETAGTFRESIASTSNTWDRFSFAIPIEAKKTAQSLYLALRYTVDDQEFWDNNNGMNYEIVITPNVEKITEKRAEIDADSTTTTETTLGPIATSNINSNEQEKEQALKTNSKKDLTKVLGRRYDFTASLTAARKPISPPPSPPGTPLDTENFNYTPPVFFSDSHVTYQRTQPTKQQRKPPSPTQPIDIPVENTPPPSPPMSAEGFQMSYSDFVNKYCFYNSHSNPIYSTFSTSPSAVLS